jgi:hypothetical protein
MADPEDVTEAEERAIISFELRRISARLFTPKRFRVNVGTATVRREGSAQDIEALVRSAIDAEEGHLVRSVPGLILAVVMSGAGRMNPAVVSARITAEPAGGSVRVALRGVAAEGLVKQHAGERAVQAVKQRLES